MKRLQAWLQNLGKTYTLDELQNLKRLNLSNNNLTCLPDEIGKLHNLKGLDLYNNNLTCLPDEIGKLQNLEVLDLYNNGVIISNANLGNIKHLDIEGTILVPSNRLTGLLFGVGNGI